LADGFLNGADRPGADGAGCSHLPAFEFVGGAATAGIIRAA
jgi:hypothetical protein